MFRLLRFLRPYRLHGLLGPACKLLEAIFELFVPLVVADMVDRGVASGDVGYVMQRGWLLVSLVVLGMAFSLVCQTLASRASQGVGTDMRRALFHHINTLDWTNQEKLGAPTLIQRMTGDINQMQVAVAMLIRLVVRAPFLVIGALIMAFRINVQLAMIFVAIIGLMSLILYLVMSRTVPSLKQIQKNNDQMSNTIRENLSGARVVRAFRSQEREESRFIQVVEAVTKTYTRVGKYNAALAPLCFLVLNVGILAVLYFGGYLVDGGRLTQGQLIALVQYMNQILLALVVTANLVVIFTKAAASAQRINEVFDLQPAIVYDGSVQALPDARGEVRFNHIYFSYHGNQSDDHSEESVFWALRDVTLSAPPGSHIGIIGATGSGKSTLVQLLPRLYDAVQGEVLLDGVAVRDYPRQELHRRVAMVSQQASLFSGTIRDNLLWRSPDATDEMIWRALAIAQAEDFVRSMPKGLDAIVAQGGANLSGGQKQRLTIARALVGSPNVLILDDSSSALDYATDRALRDALAHMQDPPTRLSVSQRIGTVRGCDEIWVMEAGEVVGVGTHDQLIKSCLVYQEICKTQLRKEEWS